MQDFVQQVVKEIVAGVRELDPVCRRMFLNWMGNHASQVRCVDEDPYQDCLAIKLSVWLDSMSMVGILWEYRLIMVEIEWWKNLEQATRERIAAEELK
jgi:hypothetical protein